MNLVGKKVKHKTLGFGVVTAHEKDILTIDFSTKTSKFPYSEAIFTSFLVLEDAGVQETILKEFEEIRKVNEQKRKTEVLLKQKEEEIKQKLLEAKRMLLRVDSPKRVSRQERIHGKRMTFYVFQGSTFDRESRGGYIWAPISNQAGRTFHHWDRLLDVQPGDIIFHGYNAHIQAISVAKARCYECNQPEELRTENLWDQEGRRVDCDYVVLRNPIKTSYFTRDIIRLCNVKYAPFDKDGNGNMGYLYELNRELARIFLQGVVTANPVLSNIDFISGLLEE